MGIAGPASGRGMGWGVVSAMMGCCGIQRRQKRSFLLSLSLSLSLSALSYRTMRCVARIMETNLYAPLACLHAKRASWLIMSAVKIPYDDEVLKHVPGMIEDITRWPVAIQILSVDREFLCKRVFLVLRVFFLWKCTCARRGISMIEVIDAQRDNNNLKSSTMFKN